jgi:peptide/nickel transport system permease protein
MGQFDIDPLQQALQLINAGEGRKASIILARFLQENPDHERAWHLLSYALADPEQQIYALRRVLEINPGNRAARSQLARLVEAPASSTPRPASKASPRPVDVAFSAVKSRPRFRDRVLSSPSLVAGALIVLLFAAVALAAPLIAPPGETDSVYWMPRHGYDPTPRPPQPGHPLGLLPEQYDGLYGLVWGTRLAFIIGLGVTAGRLLIGVSVGLLSGYAGGWLDALIMRITDGFLAFPIIAAAMVMIALYSRELHMGPDGGYMVMAHGEEKTAIAALLLFGWMSYTRLIRGNILSERQREYMEAARAIGARPWRLLWRHLWPNTRQGLFVLAASDVGAVVVLAAMFSFVGLLRAPLGNVEADWGQILSLARDWIVGSPANAFEYWYTYIPASAAVVLFSMGWNLFGDGLRDVLDPRWHRARGLGG